MDETIDQGDGAGRIGKDLRPLREGTIGRDQRAARLVTTVDQLEEQIGVSVRIRQMSICGTLRPANRGVMRPAEVAVLAVSDGSVLRRFQASCNVASGDRKGVQGTVE
jgi:hypothetical protein